jgi:transcriptional regulator with XRE-family HTH domain
MEKTIYSREYEVFREVLRRVRIRTGLTQVELAERLKVGQSWVSKIERGELRMDIIQLRIYCEAMGIAFSDFIEELEGDLKEAKTLGRG